VGQACAVVLDGDQQMAMVLLLAFLITPLFKGDARTFVSLSFYCLVRVVPYLSDLRGTGLR